MPENLGMGSPEAVIYGLHSQSIDWSYLAVKVQQQQPSNMYLLFNILFPCLGFQLLVFFESVGCSLQIVWSWLCCMICLVNFLLFWELTFKVTIYMGWEHLQFYSFVLCFSVSSCSYYCLYFCYNYFSVNSSNFYSFFVLCF